VYNQTQYVLGYNNIVFVAPVIPLTLILFQYIHNHCLHHIKSAQYHHISIVFRLLCPVHRKACTPVQ